MLGKMIRKDGTTQTWCVEIWGNTYDVEISNDERTILGGQECTDIHPLRLDDVPDHIASAIGAHWQARCAA